MRPLTLVSLAVLLCLVPPAHAIDHKNLDEGRPLRLEDAYPIASGELALEAGVGFTLQRRGADRALLPLEVLYGAYPNLQFGLGSHVSTDPHEIDEQAKSGDLQLSVLYNFNQETLTVPALGVKLTLNVPTGVDSSGADVELKGIVTKSFNRVSVHLNAAYAVLTGTRRHERDGQYQFIVGASYPVGAPRYTRTTLVADVFIQQAPRRGESEIVGAEVGFRHQLTPRLVLDAGIGSEFTGPADRSRFFITTGLSVGF